MTFKKVIPFFFISLFFQTWISLDYYYGADGDRQTSNRTMVQTEIVRPVDRTNGADGVRQTRTSYNGSDGDR